MRMARMFGADHLNGDSNTRNVAIDVAIGLMTGLALVVAVWMLAGTLHA
jgi:hypothetical protein